MKERIIKFMSEVILGIQDLTNLAKLEVKHFIGSIGLPKTLIGITAISATYVLGAISIFDPSMLQLVDQTLIKNILLDLSFALIVFAFAFQLSTFLTFFIIGASALTLAVFAEFIRSARRKIKFSQKRVSFLDRHLTNYFYSIHIDIIIKLFFATLAFSHFFLGQPLLSVLKFIFLLLFGVIAFIFPVISNMGRKLSWERNKYVRAPYYASVFIFILTFSSYTLGSFRTNYLAATGCTDIKIGESTITGTLILTSSSHQFIGIYSDNPDHQVDIVASPHSRTQINAKSRVASSDSFFFRLPMTRKPCQ